ncbi:MAG: 50S ribosomal protein L10 [Betaproteobacteria bacterium AqS2]|uniref:Large ribosomal subunit protein uL10 n=1 Tax=Candidatus Amphirhobacter heronislandensis TaxID=1732024 RepID=A0A930UCX4_9GAMM|nr:50S ribosomal protein L10 [Betaproteobacteria bacterium AqS2]
MSAPAAAERMSVQRRRKVGMAELFAADCGAAEGVFVAAYAGLSVADMMALRRSARAADCRVRVVKNTVAKRVLAADERFAALASSLQGPLLYGTGASAPAVAKMLRDFAKENDSLKLVAGAVDGGVLDVAQVEKFASLPSRDELRGILAATLNAPIAKLARTLADAPGRLARAVAAVRDGKAA